MPGAAQGETDFCCCSNSAKKAIKMYYIRLGPTVLETAVSFLICHKLTRSVSVISNIRSRPEEKHNAKFNLSSWLVFFFCVLCLRLKQCDGSLQKILSGGLGQ